MSEINATNRCPICNTSVSDAESQNCKECGWEYVVIPNEASENLTRAINDKTLIYSKNYNNFQKTKNEIKGLHEDLRKIQEELVITKKALSDLQEQNRYDLSFEDGHYIGETQDGLMHGSGTRYWDNGKKWDGNWLNGKANGCITVSYDRIITYYGNMVNDLPNGKGIYTDPINGRIYMGDWVDFRKEGKGILLTGEGVKIYEGEWLNDKYHGYGESFLGGVCKYKGSWEKGAKNGEGIAYDQNGNIEYEGRWENNERVN